MTHFLKEINGFDNSSILFGDTDSIKIEKKSWDVID